MATWNWWNMSRKHRLLSSPDHFSLIGSTDKRKQTSEEKIRQGISEEGERINFIINILFLIVIGFEYVWKTYMYKMQGAFNKSVEIPMVHYECWALMCPIELTLSKPNTVYTLQSDWNGCATKIHFEWSWKRCYVHWRVENKLEIFEHVLVPCEMILFIHVNVILKTSSTDIDFEKNNGHCYGVFKSIIEFSQVCIASNCCIYIYMSLTTPYICLKSKHI